MVPFERALVNSYRPAIVTFPLSSRVRDIAAFVLQHATFCHPNSSLAKISPCYPRCRWMFFFGLRRAKAFIVRVISFQDFQPVWSWSTNVTDRRTDRRTDDMQSQYRAVHSSSYGNRIVRWYFRRSLCASIFILLFWSPNRYTFWKRLFKVIDFGSNRKRICDLLLVRHRNLGSILPSFRVIAGFLRITVIATPLFHPNFGGVPAEPDRRCWSQDLKPVGCEIMLEVYHSMWSAYVTSNVSYGQTDGRTGRQIVV